MRNLIKHARVGFYKILRHVQKPEFPSVCLMGLEKIPTYCPISTLVLRLRMSPIPLRYDLRRPYRLEA